MDEINHNLEPIIPGKLLGKLDLLSNKLARLQTVIELVAKEKSSMENKISDAQNRIQKILNKLPQTNDNRQLNLLDQPTTKIPHEWI